MPLVHRRAPKPLAPILIVLATTALGTAAVAPVAAQGFFGKGRGAAVDPAIPDPVRYTAALAVAPDVPGLADSLRDASTLIADEAEPVSGSLGLLAKARNDRRRLVAALYENARYEGIVTILIEGRDIATLPPDAQFDTSRPVPVEIRVQPGQLFRIGPTRLLAGSTPVDPATYELTPGSDAGSVRILDAENRFLRDLRNDGRPFVAITDREVIADSNTGLVEYRIATSPGERVPFGRTAVTGTQAVRPGFVAYMAGIEPGTVYSPDTIEAARQRLVDLAVFSSVTVREADAQAPDGTLPVLVEVAERPFNTIGAGATISNTEGAGFNAYYERRNLFGQAESLRLEGAVSRIGANELSTSGREISGIDFRGSAVFRAPGVLGPDSVYVGSLEALREQPLAYDRLSFAVTSGVQYEIDERQSVDSRVRLEYEEITDFLGTAEFAIVSLPTIYTFDARDDELNPTEGFAVTALIDPGFDALGSTAFVRARGDVSTYLSFDENDRFVVAGRAALGTILGADLLDVPNSRRFYAGGGGSVRGYLFQSIGPYHPPVALPGTNADFVDTPTGGLSLFEASVELRVGVTENIQIVPFLDGGTVSDDLFPDFGEFKLGAGIGARYLTGFGPIRVDVGVPLDRGPRDSSFQIYAGIGQAF